MQRSFQSRQSGPGSRFGGGRGGPRDRDGKSRDMGHPRLRTKKCRLCQHKTESVDYKNLAVLSRLCTSQAKMVSRKRSGMCAPHQRLVQKAIKQARIMALLPFVG
ncbi:MAG: 30S ribosomal protein S18 [Planctomycetes bacterium]|nr:30S ribosomal protein S18 [Planctomycetota bacterium]